VGENTAKKTAVLPIIPTSKVLLPFKVPVQHCTGGRSEKCLIFLLVRYIFSMIVYMGELLACCGWTCNKNT